MLLSLKELEGYSVICKDGSKGTINSFLFDDDNQIIRYLVLDLGRILPGRKVLVSPMAIEETSWETRAIKINLTQSQIENSPDIDLNRPVSRQKEAEYRAYFHWEPYWPTGAVASPMPVRPAIRQPAISGITPPAPPSGPNKPEEGPDESGNPHLRSTKEVIGYGIQASDGKIGHVEDFIADDEVWFLRYLVVDTRDWLPGKKVLVAFEWVESIDWGSRDLHVNLTMESVKNSPKYDPTKPVNREYETVFYDYYGREKYWMR